MIAAGKGQEKAIPRMQVGSHGNTKTESHAPGQDDATYGSLDRDWLDKASHVSNSNDSNVTTSLRMRSSARS